MVQGQGKDQLHIPFMAEGCQLLKVFLCSEDRIDPVIIRDIIFMIGRGQENRSQPDSLNAQAVPGSRIPVVQVIHPVDDSPQVTDTVPVGIGEGSHKNLIEHPVVVFHVQAFSFPGGKAGQENQRQQQDDETFHAYSLLSAAFICIMDQSLCLVKGLKMIWSIFSDINPWVLFDGSLSIPDFEITEWIMLFISLLILFIVGYLQEKGIAIRDRILSYPAFIRGTVYLCAIFIVIIFGKYGSDFDAGSFIYAGF